MQKRRLERTKNKKVEVDTVKKPVEKKNHISSFKPLYILHKGDIIQTSSGNIGVVHKQGWVNVHTAKKQYACATYPDLEQVVADIVSQLDELELMEKSDRKFKFVTTNPVIRFKGLTAKISFNNLTILMQSIVYKELTDESNQ